METDTLGLVDARAGIRNPSGKPTFVEAKVSGKSRRFPAVRGTATETRGPH
jgi:hypothetical protein